MGLDYGALTAVNGLVGKMYEWEGEWSGVEWMGDTP